MHTRIHSHICTHTNTHTYTHTHIHNTFIHTQIHAHIHKYNTLTNTDLHIIITCSDAFCVLTGIGGVWSSHAEMQFLTSLAFDGFGLHMLR